MARDGVPHRQLRSRHGRPGVERQLEDRDSGRSVPAAARYLERSSTSKIHFDRKGEPNACRTRSVNRKILAPHWVSYTLDAERQGCGGRKGPAAVMPPEASPDIAPQQLDAGAHDDLHIGLHPEHLHEFRNRRQRSCEVRIPEADELRAALECRQDAEPYGRALAGIPAQRQNRDARSASRGEIGRIAAVRSVLPSSTNTRPTSLPVEASCRKASAQPGGFVVTGNDELQPRRHAIIAFRRRRTPSIRTRDCAAPTTIRHGRSTQEADSSVDGAAEGRSRGSSPGPNGAPSRTRAIGGKSAAKK